MRKILVDEVKREGPLMMETMPCPICGSVVKFDVVTQLPVWYANDSDLMLKIHCADGCRDYEIDAARDGNGGVKIEASIKTLLDSLSDAQRAFVSETSQRLRDSDCWLIWNRGGIEELLENHRFGVAAAAQYGLRNARLKHSGAGFDGANMLFFVDADGERFTMRIHQARANYNEIRSKIYWLKALREQAKIQTLEPIAAPYGELIQTVSVNDASEFRYCLLYRWLDGQMFGELKDGSRTLALINNYGRVVGRMHRLSETLEVPDWFALAHRYDGARFSRFASHPESLHSEFPKVEKKLLALMDELGEGRDVFGLVHAELAGHNVVVCGDEPKPIDVMRFGWGYYLADIQKAIQLTLREPEYGLFLDGYREVRPLPGNFEYQLEVFREARRVGRRWF